MAKIVLIDDHGLLRNGLAGLVKSQGHEVLFEAANGKIFIEKLDENNLPDIVLLDINMPEMNGFETADWIKQNQPRIKVLALSMYDDETSIIHMLKNGARGYILKDSDPSELETAIDSILKKGFHYSELVSGKLIHAIKSEDKDSDGIATVDLSEKEIEFLKYCCTEMNYKEISDHMNVSPRTVDNYRDALFKKLEVKSRIGLAIYAFKNHLVNI